LGVWLVPTVTVFTRFRSPPTLHHFVCCSSPVVPFLRFTPFTRFFFSCAFYAPRGSGYGSRLLRGSLCSYALAVLSRSVPSSFGWFPGCVVLHVTYRLLPPSSVDCVLQFWLRLPRSALVAARLFWFWFAACFCCQFCGSTGLAVLHCYSTFVGCWTIPTAVPRSLPLHFCTAVHYTALPPALPRLLVLHQVGLFAVYTRTRTAPLPLFQQFVTTTFDSLVLWFLHTFTLRGSGCRLPFYHRSAVVAPHAFIALHTSCRFACRALLFLPPVLPGVRLSNTDISARVPTCYSPAFLVCWFCGSVYGLHGWVQLPGLKLYIHCAVLTVLPWFSLHAPTTFWFMPCCQRCYVYIPHHHTDVHHHRFLRFMRFLHTRSTLVVLLHADVWFAAAHVLLIPFG